MFTHERLKYNMLKSATKQACNRETQSLGLVRMIIFYQNINDTVFNFMKVFNERCVNSSETSSFYNYNLKNYGLNTFFPGVFMR